MSESMALVGLDVHQAQSVAAVLDPLTAQSFVWSGCGARRGMSSRCSWRAWGQQSGAMSCAQLGRHARNLDPELDPVAVPRERAT
jgi:hypothetical protein